MIGLLFLTLRKEKGRKDLHDEGVLCFTDITARLSYGTANVCSSAADGALTKRALAESHG